MFIILTNTQGNWKLFNFSAVKVCVKLHFQTIFKRFLKKMPWPNGFINAKVAKTVVKKSPYLIELVSNGWDVDTERWLDKITKKYVVLYLSAFKYKSYRLPLSKSNFIKQGVGHFSTVVHNFRAAYKCGNLGITLKV